MTTTTTPAGSDTPDAARPGGCPRWMKFALIGSVAVNLAIAGLFIGNAVRDKPGARGIGNQVEWIIRMVPDHRRDFTKAHFVDIRDDLRVSRKRRDAHLDEIVALIRAEPFDAETLTGALEIRRQSSTARRLLVHDRLVALLSAFTEAERAVFAERLEANLAKRRARRAER